NQTPRMRSRTGGFRVARHPGRGVTFYLQPVGCERLQGGRSTGGTSASLPELPRLFELPQLFEPEVDGVLECGLAGRGRTAPVLLVQRVSCLTHRLPLTLPSPSRNVGWCLVAVRT